MSSGLASPQKTTPSLTDFRCWPPTSEGPNPWCHYHHHQVCIADNCSSSLDHVLVLLNTLTALRLKVSQKHMTSASHMTSTPMILHALGLNLSTSYQTSTHLFWLSCFGQCKPKQACKPRSYASSKLRPTDRVTDSEGWSVELLA